MEVLTTPLHGVPVLKVIGDVDHLDTLGLDAAVPDDIGAVAPNRSIVRLFEIVGFAGDFRFRVFASSEETRAAVEG